VEIEQEEGLFFQMQVEERPHHPQISSCAAHISQLFTAEQLQTD